MANPDQTIIRLRHPRFPSDLTAGLKPLRKGGGTGRSGSGGRVMERNGGRSLIRQLVQEELGNGKLRITESEGGKPSAEYGGAPLYLNISHAGGMVGGVISTVRELGFDLESAGRPVADGLRERILHPQEVTLMSDHDLLQIWTIKEAALKWCGSGLRIAMRSVRIVGAEGSQFSVSFVDGRVAEICSFRYDTLWVSVAWSPEPDLQRES